MTTFAVSTAQELDQALISANGGDRIVLQSGDYGDLSIQYLDFGSKVTITSADPGDPATFSSIGIYESSNLIFDKVAVDFVPTADTVEWSSAVRVTQSSDIEFLNSQISGGNAVAGVPADSDPSVALADGRNFSTNGVDGYPIGRAVSVFHSEDLVFHNNDISDFKGGIILGNVDRIDITENAMYGLRTVMIAGGDVSDADFSGNHFSDLNPWRSHNNGDHSDFIHLWTSTNQVGQNENILINDNFFEQGDTGGKVIGIYLEDNNKDIGYKNVTIENNLLHNGGSQGFTVENTNWLIIRDNTLLQSSGGSTDAPGILLLDNTRNAVVDNNVLSDFWGASYENAVALNISLTNNLSVQRLDPHADNHVSNLYVNPLVQNGTLDDFTVIPGSLADGMGANLTQIDASKLFVAITAQNHTGLEQMRLDFSAELLAGSVNLSKADISWDFGDGTSFDGPNVSHTFAQTGSYMTRATVTLENGQVIILHKQIEVSTPIAVQSSFDQGIKDTTDLVNTVGAQSDVELVNSGVGKVLNLKTEDAVLRFNISDELQNNPEFTLGFDFRYDAGAQDGKVIYMPGAAIINLTGGEIELSSNTDRTEKIKIESKGARVNDGNWHQLTYVFSQAAGTATLYLDGDVIGKVSGLEGSQGFSHYHGLNVGSPFGSSFTGQVDNLQFLRGALDEGRVPSEVGSLYQIETGNDVVITQEVQEQAIQGGVNTQDITALGLTEVVTAIETAQPVQTSTSPTWASPNFASAESSSQDPAQVDDTQEQSQTTTWKNFAWWSEQELLALSDPTFEDGDAQHLVDVEIGGFLKTLFSDNGDPQGTEEASDLIAQPVDNQFEWGFDL